MAAFHFAAAFQCEQRSGLRMSSLIFAGSTLLLVPLIAFSQQAADSAETRFQQLWSQAEQFASQDQYEAAAQQYRAILAEFPKSQRAALRIAVNLEQAGKTADALKAYDAGLAVDPRGAWADVTLFYKARAGLNAGAKTDGLAAIQLLRETYPDSSYSVRALTLQAQARGESSQDAEKLLALELQAAQAYDEGSALAAASKDADALTKLREVQSTYPDSAAALRAQEESSVPFQGVQIEHRRCSLNSRNTRDRSFDRAKRIGAVHNAANRRGECARGFLTKRTQNVQH